MAISNTIDPENLFALNEGLRVVVV